MKCTWCKSDATVGVFCAHHAEANKMAQRRSYARRRKAGQCMHCPNPAVKGIRCWDCAERHKSNMRRYREAS